MFAWYTVPSCDSANTSAQQDTKKRQCDASYATGPWRVWDSIRTNVCCRWAYSLLSCLRLKRQFNTTCNNTGMKETNMSRRLGSVKLFSSRHGLNTRGLGSTLNASSASTDDLETLEAHGLTNFPIFFRLQRTVFFPTPISRTILMTVGSRKLKVFSESHLQAYMDYTICTILGLSLLLRGLSGSLSSSRVASRGLVPQIKSTRYRTSLAVSTRSISPRITVEATKKFATNHPKFRYSRST